MISIIITAFKEADSVRKAIIKFRNQFGLNPPYELMVVAPDAETERVCKEFDNVRYVKDPGIGKPAALNLAFRKAKGNILVLTDGDVFPSPYAVRELTKFFVSPNVGAVSGRPCSISPKDTMLGYWSHVLVDTADAVRRKCTKNRAPIVCSGYLYAIRAGIVKDMPEDILSDDAYISYMIEKAGYKIMYAGSAQVFVKYPSTFSDWIKQKARSTGGYDQLKQMGIEPPKAMRGFWQEVKDSAIIFKYIESPKEFWWTIALCFARVYLWAKIYYDRRIKKKSFEETWVRIETTK